MWEGYLANVELLRVGQSGQHCSPLVSSTTSTHPSRYKLTYSLKPSHKHHVVRYIDKTYQWLTYQWLIYQHFFQKYLTKNLPYSPKPPAEHRQTKTWIQNIAFTKHRQTKTLIQNIASHLDGHAEYQHRSEQRIFCLDIVQCPCKFCFKSRGLSVPTSCQRKLMLRNMCSSKSKKYWNRAHIIFTM